MSSSRLTIYFGTTFALNKYDEIYNELVSPISLLEFSVKRFLSMPIKQVKV